MPDFYGGGCCCDDSSETAEAKGLRRSYGNGRLTIDGDPLGLTQAQMAESSSASGWGKHAIENFDDYSQCLWRITIGETTVTDEFEGLRFLTFADLVTWMQANIPNNGSSYQAYSTFEVYDVVSGTVPGVGKVFGHNRTYKELIRDGTGTRYLSPDTRAFPTGQSGAPKAALLDALWNAAWGTPLSASVGPVAGWGAAELGLFWHHSRSRTMYRVPNLNVLELQGTGNRQGLSAANVISQATGQWRGDPNPRPEPWAYVSSPLGLTAINPFGVYDARTQLVETLTTEAESVVVGIPIWNPATGERAMYVKPIGIDEVFVAGYDATKYRLEIVGTMNNRNGTKLVVPTTIEFNNPGQRCAGPLNPSHWRSVIKGFTSSVSSRGDFVGPGEIRFQLRDLETGCVSVLSSSAVTAQYRRRGAPFSWELQHAPHI